MVVQFAGIVKIEIRNNMPTLKQWEQFKKWRIKRIEEIKNSDEYKEQEQLRSRQLELLETNSFPETIEGCMDWLLSESKKG